MSDRCPDATMVGIGCLPGYELVFNRQGTHHEGAVGSIELSSDHDAHVYGIIWRLSQKDIHRMDQFENPEAYSRSKLSVKAADGQLLSCYVYIAFPQDIELDPDPIYLERIITAAQDVGLHSDYVEKLKSYRS